MAKYIYKNAKIASTSYIYFKLNYYSYIKVFYKKDVSF